MGRRHRQQIWLAWALCLTSWVACGQGGDAPPPPGSLQTDPQQMRALVGVEASPVVGIAGDFDVQQRQHQIGQFPCARCHEQPQELTSLSEANPRWAHANIRAIHPARGSCNTCHNYDDLQTLRLQDGTTVDVNQVYQLCSQCHFEQAQDWAGGAHGKRLGGWRGRRVIMNCTDCHDPHAPAFGPEIPVAGPRIPRTARRH